MEPLGEGKGEERGRGGEWEGGDGRGGEGRGGYHNVMIIQKHTQNLPTTTRAMGQAAIIRKQQLQITGGGEGGRGEGLQDRSCTTLVVHGSAHPQLPALLPPPPMGALCKQ